VDFYGQPFPKGLKRRFQLIEPGVMAGVEQSVDLRETAMQSPRQFGLADALRAHNPVETDLRLCKRWNNDTIALTFGGGRLWNIAPVLDINTESGIERVDSLHQRLFPVFAKSMSFWYIGEDHFQGTVVVRLQRDIAA
jgi:hypothetical protein